MKARIFLFITGIMFLTVSCQFGQDNMDMTTEGTPLNVKWTTEVLDKIADALTILRDSGVVVLWRPFHEMNGDWFWWCPHNAKTKEWRPNEDLKGIWVQMYNYFTNIL